MPIFILARYAHPARGKTAALKVGEWAFEADDAGQARDIAASMLGDIPSGQVVILWDDHANAIWEESAYA